MKNVRLLRRCRILIGFILFIGTLSGCADYTTQIPEAYRNEKLTENGNTILTASAAEQWYNTHYDTIVTFTPGNSKKKVIAKPDWQHAKESRRGRFEAVETSLLSKGIFFMLDEETSRHWKPGEDASRIRNTVKLVVLRDMVTEEIRSFVMVFVGSYEYLYGQGDMGRNSYLYRDPNYDGAVYFYTINGGFINGWKYKNGKITSTLRRKSPHTIKPNN